MNIKIQNFTLLLFILMTLALIMLWSTSLYVANNSANQQKEMSHRENWQAQLDQLQLTQNHKLHQHFHEVSKGLAKYKDPQKRVHFINQYYQSYPQLRLIQIEPVEGDGVPNNKGISDCFYSLNNLVTRLHPSIPVVTACQLNSKPMLGISAEINVSKPQTLVVLLDYFSFITDFEKTTGRSFVADKKNPTKFHYTEINVSEKQRQVSFEFVHEKLQFGSLLVVLTDNDFMDVWIQQVFWVVPCLFIITLTGYLVFIRAFISPLLQITSRAKKVILARRPGNEFRGMRLTSGLKLLHKYCMHLTFMTKRDPLTGLNNRATFEERLQQALLEGKRSGQKYALVLIDINQFYKVNQEFGHYLGDGLLKQLADRLNDGCRESDSLARLEKDNFALLLGFSDEAQVTSIVDKLYQSLSKPYTIYGREISVGISIGVAIYPDHAQKMEELELKGNEALISAHKGDRSVVFIEQSSDRTDYTGYSMIQMLRQALKNKDFKLVYQPVIELENHTTRYFEALLRWKQPESQSLSIEKTIALAEKSQLIKPLSLWIIEAACGQLKKIEDSLVKIAVNLSMIDFHDESLPERIGEILQRYEVSPDKLMVEITEGQIMQDSDRVIAILTRLSSMGISLSIDDFGTGQASLTYLKNLPVEKLKIDQSFVKDMIADEEDRAIVEATIKLAHTLGIEVVAEGVESAEIHSLLVEMGCDYAQGYYISKPIDHELMSTWIMDKQRRLSSH